MVCTSIDKQVAEVYNKLAKEYALDIDPGEHNVNSDRQMVLELFTSPEVMSAIEELGIELISYVDLVK